LSAIQKGPLGQPIPRAVFDPVEAMKPDAPLIHPDYASYEGPRSKAPDL
jgi:hypothetical protein